MFNRFPELVFSTPSCHVGSFWLDFGPIIATFRCFIDPRTGLRSSSFIDPPPLRKFLFFTTHRLASLALVLSCFSMFFQHMSVRNVIKTTKTNSRPRLLTFRPLGSHFSLFLSHFHRFRNPFPLPNGLQSRPFALPDAPRVPPEPHWVPTLDPTGLQHVHQGPFSHHGTSFWTETVRFRTNFRSFSVPVRPPDIRIHTDTSQPNHLDTSISEGRRGTRSANCPLLFGCQKPVQDLKQAHLSMYLSSCFVSRVL